jgi:hypothetical protein
VGVIVLVSVGVWVDVDVPVGSGVCVVVGVEVDGQAESDAASKCLFVAVGSIVGSHGLSVLVDVGVRVWVGEGVRVAVGIDVVVGGHAEIANGLRSKILFVALGVTVGSHGRAVIVRVRVRTKVGSLVLVLVLVLVGLSPWAYAVVLSDAAIPSPARRAISKIAAEIVVKICLFTMVSSKRSEFSDVISDKQHCFHHQKRERASD